VLVRFFFELREAGVPVSLTEFLALLQGLEARVATCSAEEFYWFARLALVKDERHYDRFDRVFAAHFEGAERLFAKLVAEVPAEWLRSLAERLFTAEERAKVEALGSWDKLLETLRERLAEQKERHEGGNKWIGTGGTSPFGSGGYNPEGVRIGNAGARQRRAVKVWESREYRNFDDQRELGTRNLKMALRRLRKFARQGAADELDLDGTIEATARNAGWISSCAPNAATPSRCCCCSTSAARWTTTCGYARNCSRPCAASSGTSSISTSTTSSTRRCGKTIGGAMRSARRRSICCAPSMPTIA
jgi:uncharacterized protein with von Willebrand factor type A (vWA) domain